MAATQWGRWVANVAGVLAPQAVQETAAQGALPQGSRTPLDTTTIERAPTRPTDGKLKAQRRAYTLAGAEQRAAGLRPGTTTRPPAENGGALPLLLLAAGGLGLVALAATRRKG